MSARSLMLRARTLLRRGLREVPLVITVLSLADAYKAFFDACGGA